MSILFVFCPRSLRFSGESRLIKHLVSNISKSENCPRTTDTNLLYLPPTLFLSPTPPRNLTSTYPSSDVIRISSSLHDPPQPPPSSRQQQGGPLNKRAANNPIYHSFQAEVEKLQTPSSLLHLQTSTQPSSKKMKMSEDRKERMTSSTS